MSAPTKSKIDPQLIIAIGVLIISLSALFVSIRQASIMNKQTEVLLEQTKSSAWPYLEIGLSKSMNEKGGISRFLINVANKGTGPAIIAAVRVLYKDKPARNWSEFYRLTTIPDTIQGLHSNAHLSNSVISENDFTLFLNLTNNPKLMEWVFERADELRVEICYKSVFGDYWLVSRTGFRTNLEVMERQEIEGCTFAEGELFME